MRWFGGDSSKVAKFRQESDRQEQARLRMAIARGAEHDRPTEPDKPIVIVQSPAATPPVDKAKLASFVRDEVRQAVRAEVAKVRDELIAKQSEAVAEIVMRMEGGNL